MQIKFLKMKKILFLLSLIFLASCDSYFSDLPENDISLDPEGDPIIQNPKNYSFGNEGSYCYGYGTPSDIPIAEIDTDIDYPASYDLSKFLPQVDSQGSQGSCVAWATGYYLKSFHENLEDFNNGITTNNNTMSPSYIFNQIKVNPCSGSRIEAALKLISNSGITSLNDMPYNDQECDIQPTEEQNQNALENKINTYYYLDGEKLFDQAKAFLLNNQPIVIGISIDINYFGAIDENRNAIYQKFKKIDGSHAMLVVGYDDVMKAFKVVNSWGESWGNQGFVWIDYKAFQEVMDTNSDFKILCQAWVTEDVIK